MKTGKLYEKIRILAYKMGMIADVHEKSKMQEQMQQNSIFDMTSLMTLINQAWEGKFLSQIFYI